jgi:hypothetical protein
MVVPAYRPWLPLAPSEAAGPLRLSRLRAPLSGQGEESAWSIRAHGSGGNLSCHPVPDTPARRDVRPPRRRYAEASWQLLLQNR